MWRQLLKTYPSSENTFWILELLQRHWTFKMVFPAFLGQCWKVLVWSPDNAHYERVELTIGRKGGKVTLRDSGYIMRTKQRDLWLKNDTHLFYPSQGFFKYWKQKLKKKINPPVFDQPFLWVWVLSSFELRSRPVWSVENIAVFDWFRGWFINKWLNNTNTRITSLTNYMKCPQLPPILSHLKERHFSGLLHQQMELIDLLPHQRGDRVTAGNDALRLSGKIREKIQSWKLWIKPLQSTCIEVWTVDTKKLI